MRTSSEDDREELHGTVEGVPGLAPTGSRRAVLGLTAGGLAKATSGLLLPAWMADEASAAEGQVVAQHRGNRRRHRRHHHRSHDQALAVLAVTQPIAIPSGPMMAIRFGIVMALQGFTTRDDTIVSPSHSGHYRLELFQSWNGSGARSSAAVMVLVNENTISTSNVFLSPSITTGTDLRDIQLRAGDMVQLTAQQDSGAPLDLVAGTVVLQLIDR